VNDHLQSPRTPRQRLGAELRRLRVLAGVSGRELAHRTGMSQSKVSRIERGDALASVPELTLWLEQCNAADQLPRMIEATDAALNQLDDWRDLMRADSFATMQDQVRQRERIARTQRVFQPTLVPGLLQTAQYARLIFVASDLTGGQDYAAAVQGRLDRQQILYDQEHSFEFILTEAALRWRPGSPEVLLAQIDRITSLATLSNVSIGVVPLDVGTTVIPWHGFSLHEDVEGQDPFVQVEIIHAYMTVTKPEDVDLYRRQFDALAKSSLSGQAATDLLFRLRAQLMSRA
jgi:transcriptional regulator with XRE-family HTH domain